MSGPAGVDRVFRSRRVATPAGIRPAAIHVAGGRIVAVADDPDLPAGAGLVDAGDAVIFPGLVDTHVHVNEPGRSDWEGFTSATRAAAAGGVTTLLDMPLNSIPATITVAALDAKRQAADGRIAVDVGFLGGAVPGNGAELAALHAAGVFGFKCFLCPSGVDEFPHVTPDDLGRTLAALGDLDALLMVHAELPDRLRAPAGDSRRYATWLTTRPVEAETGAVALLAALAETHGARVHVVHVSSAETVALVTAARAARVRMTAETCPHYLSFAAADIPDAATAFKCAPPVREARHREALWQALALGELDMIVSDHSPAPPAMRLPEQGDFFRAWGGIASLQLRLPAVWTEARARGHALERLVEWLCSAPARLAGLDRSKGAIAPGQDADLVIWHPEQEFEVHGTALRHRHPDTPWLGRRLAGVVEATYLRGDLAFRRGGPDGPPRGRLLSRTGS